MCLKENWIPINLSYALEIGDLFFAFPLAHHATQPYRGHAGHGVSDDGRESKWLLMKESEEYIQEVVC